MHVLLDMTWRRDTPLRLDWKWPKLKDKQGVTRYSSANLGVHHSAGWWHRVLLVAMGNTIHREIVFWFCPHEIFDVADTEREEWPEN